METNKNFKNPFATEREDAEKTTADASTLIGMPKPASDISRISPWISNRNPSPIKIKKDQRGEYVTYSGKMFLPGDIVEVCPCKILRSIDIYSEPVSDLCFNVGNDEYALPFGYAAFYQNSTNSRKKGNVDYTWVQRERSIIFKAIRKIQEGDELIIETNTTEY